MGSALKSPRLPHSSQDTGRLAQSHMKERKRCPYRFAGLMNDCGELNHRAATSWRDDVGDGANRLCLTDIRSITWTQNVGLARPVNPFATLSWVHGLIEDRSSTSLTHCIDILRLNDG
jgi:hypothetical protein